MAKKAVQAMRPYWASRRNAGVAGITFTRKLGEATKIHSLAELQQLQEQLEKIFREICLAGDFTLVFIAKEKGGPDTKGLTLFGVSKNSVLVAFQPGSNDTRFSYGIPLPSSDMAMDVHARLVEALKRLSTERDLKRPSLTLVPKDESVVSVVMTAVEEPTVAASEVTHRVAEIQSGDQLMMVEFDASLDGETPFEALKEQVLEVLKRHGSEGVFVVKKGVPTKTNTSGAVGVQWCRLQLNANGIGFWFRESSAASWQKYALVPDNSFDLEAFATEVAPAASTEVRSDVKGIRHNMHPVSAQDLVEDESVYSQFLIALAEHMQKKGLQEVPGSDVTKVFAAVVHEAYAPTSVGRLLAKWSDMGLLRRTNRYASGKFVFSFGLSAAKFLPESLKGLAPKRVQVTPERGTEVAAALAAKTANAPSKLQPAAAVVPKTLVPAVAKTAATKVLDSNAVDDALAVLTKQEQAIAEAKAKLSQFIEVSAQMKEQRVEIAAIDAEINALHAKRQAVMQKHDELAAKLPSAEMVSAMMSSLRS